MYLRIANIPREVSNYQKPTQIVAERRMRKSSADPRIRVPHLNDNPYTKHPASKHLNGTPKTKYDVHNKCKSCGMFTPNEYCIYCSPYKNKTEPRPYNRDNKHLQNFRTNYLDKKCPSCNIYLNSVGLCMKCYKFYT